MTNTKRPSDENFWLCAETAALRAEVLGWDGKEVGSLEDLFERHRQSPHLGESLVRLLNEKSEISRTAASWLLKTYLSEGNGVTPSQVETTYRGFQNGGSWAHRLHLLQSMPYLPIGGDVKLIVEQFLRIQLNDTNKFVRAWSYNGFHLLAAQHPEYRTEVDQFLERGLRDEAPSVKARIRQILKLG